MSDALEREVLAFYRACAFNTYGSVRRQIRDVRAQNQLAGQYADLDALLAGGEVSSFLDVGCGAGWLALTVDHYYGLCAHGVDFNPEVIALARAAALRMRSRATFATANLFALVPAEGTYDVVCAMGVLHHTPDPRRAAHAIARLVAPGPAARLYLGLYHRFGRRPFLAHFQALREAGRSERELFAAFAALHRGLRDRHLLRSWFRDQVLHPHESQHTLAEVAGWLDEAGFEVVSTSINRYAPFARLAELVALEPAWEELSRRRNLAEGRYFPGFFTVCARRRAQ
jgi:2-polyprenyl-3-methyl-5-hydroxy-6-metoxy-1,4-benzoquinol methylase